MQKKIINFIARIVSYKRVLYTEATAVVITVIVCSIYIIMSLLSAQSHPKVITTVKEQKTAAKTQQRNGNGSNVHISSGSAKTKQQGVSLLKVASPSSVKNTFLQRYTMTPTPKQTVHAKVSPTQAVSQNVNNVLADSLEKQQQITPTVTPIPTTLNTQPGNKNCAIGNQNNCLVAIPAIHIHL